MTQPKCPKCGGESWLDVSGKYQCVKCGHYFKIEVDPLSSPFESNPIIIKEKLLEVKRLLSEDKIEEAHDLYDSVIGYITLHTISTNSEDNKMMDELQHELFEARRLLWKKMAGLEQNPITTAKYKGFCRVCRHDIKVGQRIEYVKGLGLRHFDCLPYEQNPDRKEELQQEAIEIAKRVFGLGKRKGVSYLQKLYDESTNKAQFIFDIFMLSDVNVDYNRTLERIRNKLPQG
jgi:hypothetical protein